MQKQTISFPDPVWNTPLYAVWACMIARCENENNPEYPRYGARGITICPEWRNSFRVFKADMQNGYGEGLTLERVNNDLGYFKENCKWATVREQARNRRSNKLLTHDGKTQTLIEWCEQLNRDYNSVQLRLSRGWTAHRALTQQTTRPYRDVQDIAKASKKRNKPITLPPCE